MFSFPSTVYWKVIMSLFFFFFLSFFKRLVDCISDRVFCIAFYSLIFALLLDLVFYFKVCVCIMEPVHNAPFHLQPRKSPHKRGECCCKVDVLNSTCPLKVGWGSWINEIIHFKNLRLSMIKAHIQICTHNHKTFSVEFKHFADKSLSLMLMKDRLSSF